MAKDLDINITPEWAKHAAEREPESGIISARGYPPREYAVGTPAWAADLTDRVVRRVAELPDRTSPDNWPEAMLVTADELRGIIREEAGKRATLPGRDSYVVARPACPKCGSPMNFVDGGAPEHDVKEPHWRCETWVGGGVCGAVRRE